jgi:co-chaperonin GroES (HSP10)
MTCKVDDTVLVASRWLKGDNEVSFEDDTYVLVRESEIVMVSN